MKKAIAYLFVSTFMFFLLISCSFQPHVKQLAEGYDFQQMTETHTNNICEESPSLNQNKKSWQKAYVTLLSQYLELDEVSFLLHDFDRNGVPALIIVGMHEDEWIDIVYTFRDGSLFSLEYGEGVYIAGFALSLRSGVIAPPDNSLGLITYIVGASAGAFGTSAFYYLVVIDGDMLVIETYGRRYVDLESLHELFDDFGIGYDNDELREALQKHTHWYINDDSVSRDAFIHIFPEDKDDRLLPLKITKDNIYMVIFGNKDCVW